MIFFFFFSSRRRHTRLTCDWSSDVCSSDLSAVAGSGRGPEPIPVTLTCGTGEENLDNNRFLAIALDARGWDVRLVEHPDAHNWISWRDVLEPHLAELMLRALG